MQDITKFCADHLRAFIKNKHNNKLKASHAHELVAMLFGYKSRAALRADIQCPLNNLIRASIIVLIPSAQIEQRCRELQDLLPNLFDVHAWGEEIYLNLILEKRFVGRVSANFRELAICLADEYLHERKMDRIYRAPVSEGVQEYAEADGVRLIVSRFYQLPLLDGGVREENITTTITLRRVAGYIGYANPKVSVDIEKLGV